MKFLMYDWEALTAKYVKNALKKIGIDVTLLPGSMMQARDETTRYDFMEKLDFILHNHQYDGVFTINYFGSIAFVCHNNDIPYISWTYDSLILREEEDTLFFETNRIFSFDSGEVDYYRKRGLSRIWHCNLAVDIKHYDAIIYQYQGKKSFSSEVAFVGSLYKTLIDYIKGDLPEWENGYIDALLNVQFFEKQKNVIRNLLENNKMSLPCFQDKVVSISKKDAKFEDMVKTGIIEELFLDTVTYKDRLLMLSLLSKHFYVDLYTRDKGNHVLKNVHINPPVDYQTEMPLVFHNSKINLNMTARRIENGIPQRCLDVMACGGLLLSNQQKDFGDDIIDQKEALIYENEQEAIEKIKFYLEHDDLATKIRNAGYEKVQKCFSFERQLTYIWETAME